MIMIIGSVFHLNRKREKVFVILMFVSVYVRERVCVFSQTVRWCPGVALPCVYGDTILFFVAV